jgi:uncharacterized protein (DUF362 family)
MDRHPLSRRAFVGAALGAAAGLPAVEAAADRATLVAKPPKGFVPFSVPGKVVRVEKANTMQQNGLWPKQEAATAMLERAMAELTGRSDLGEAFAKIVHKSDKVAIKPNGIAGRKNATMAANKELVLAIVKGIVAAGVPASSITIYEQYGSFLKGTRVVDDALKLVSDFPSGITAGIHENKDASMDDVEVGGVQTKYVRFFTDATCVINVSQIKDHSICGYTGTMKNITHGSIINPHHFHAHNASPQIAQLYAQDIVKSRVRLHITDAFKVMYDEGPLDTNPKRRIVCEAVYASTDPVAQDVIGWELVEKLRKDNGLPTLKEAQREPTYLKVAAELGLGVFDKNHIRLRDVKV